MHNCFSRSWWHSRCYARASTYTYAETTTEEVLALAFDRPTHFKPGAQFEYNNTNYYLLGLVAAKIEGQPLASIFQDRLFGPLGMNKRCR